VLQLDEVVAFGEMRMLHGFGHVVDRGDRAAGLLATIHDLLLAALDGPRLDQGVDGVGVLGAREHVLEHLELHPVGVPHHARQPVPLPGLEGQHPHVAVAAREDGGGRPQRHPDPGSPIEDPVLGVGADVLGTDEGGGDRLGAGDVDLLATPHLLQAVQSRQPPGCARDRTEEVGGEGPVLEGCLVRKSAVAAARAGEVVGVQVVGLPIAVGAGLAEGRDRDHHEVGVQGGERAVVEAPTLHPCRRVVLDQDVGPGDELAQPIAFVGTADVQADAPLVGIEEVVEAALLGVRDIAGEGAPAPCDVAVGRLDLDDVGSVIREELRAVRRRHPLAELDYLDPLEGSLAHRVLAVAQSTSPARAQSTSPVTPSIAVRASSTMSKTIWRAGFMAVTKPTPWPAASVIRSSRRLSLAP